tara:strand:- start:1282 stop:2268 length:987 start_codon:yes stop_codon:yes gene_type:complete
LKNNIINFLSNNKDIGKRIDYLIAKKIKIFSRNRVQSLISSGNVSFDKIKVTNQSFKVNKIGNIEIHIPPKKKLSIEPQKIKLNIIYEDNDLIVIDKEAGMVVHPSAGNFDNTLVNALLYHCKSSLSGIGGIERPGIVHRLDKMTSGLVVVAKNDFTHLELSKQFKDRTIKKKYIAITQGKMLAKKGCVKDNIVRSRKNRTIMTTTSKNFGKDAKTSYKLIKELKFDKKLLFNLVECIISTGRTHQIRVHLSKIGNPIIGDKIYGKKIKNENLNIKLRSIMNEFFYSKERHALHSKQLGFSHPKLKKEMLFETQIPYDFKKILDLIQA